MGRNISRSVGTGTVHFRDYLAGNYPNSFMFSRVTSCDIVSVMNPLNSNRAPITVLAEKVLVVQGFPQKCPRLFN